MTDLSNTKNEIKPEDDVGHTPRKANTVMQDVDHVASVSEPELNALSPGDSINVQDLEKEGKAKVALIMSTLCLCVLLAALDQTIIATAVPVIAENFHSSATYTWIGSSYLLATSASATSWGKFSDIWGRKPILLLAVSLFFVGSLLCAISSNSTMIIGGRAVLGAGGGGVLTLVNICISDLFSMRNRPKYFGIIGIVWAFASSIGPVIGGIFTQKVCHRFVPITGICFVVLVSCLQIHNPRTPLFEGLAAVDWLGCITSIGGTIMLLIGLEFGGIKFPWSSATVICLIISGVVTTGIFIVVEWKIAKYPILPLRIFSHRSNIATLGVNFVHGFSFISAAYYIPLYFQVVLGAAPLLSGVYFLVFSISLSFTSLLAGAMISITGRYLCILRLGLALMTLGIGLLIDLPDHISWPRIALYQLVTGIGAGPNFQAPIIALQAMVAPRDIAMATATYVFIRSLAISMSIVIGGVIFQNGMQLRLPQLIQKIGPSAASILSGSSAGASVGIVASLPPPEARIARHAYWESMRNMWILYAAVGAAGIIMSIFVTEKSLSKHHEETRTGLQNLERRRVTEKTVEELAAESEEVNAEEGKEKI
ncbi:MFS general substrate transporter [Glonium stellatum]|uniref:MFS general substrate transporter n=1 Tax=Glonium stellatum TaxID=574774 RepID=A0A8E2JYD0_9PEZI|nr:MFS general substrate transporter [Glonium stellatum]